jgi:hypothetical protein
MTEIVIASVSSVFSVFVMHMHSSWMNGTQVPYWLLQLTCLARKKCESSKFSVRSNFSKVRKSYQFFPISALGAPIKVDFKLFALTAVNVLQ